MPDPEFVVVTRHSALVAYLEEQGLIQGGTHVISHAKPWDVKGKHVIGVLPLALAALASSITEVPLVLPEEARGRELTLEEIRSWAGTPCTYKVSVVEESVEESIEEANY